MVENGFDLKLNKLGRPRTSYPKILTNLEQTQLYEEHGLDYAILNRIFERSGSITFFARNLMNHFFTKSELIKCTNVTGKLGPEHLGSELDPGRVDLIRRIIEENPVSEKMLWVNCLKVMYRYIGSLNRRRR